VRKRRHHYVWQFYLSAWAVDDTVACMRAGATFRTSANNLAVRTDFYRLHELTELEVAFVKKLCIDGSDPLLQAINLGWFPIFVSPFELRKLGDALETEAPELAGALQNTIYNAQEDVHAAIEAGSVEHLASLRKAELCFLESADETNAFLHFLSVQYFRTAKIRAHVTGALPAISGINLGHVWGLMSHIFATNVSLALLRPEPVNPSETVVGHY